MMGEVLISTRTSFPSRVRRPAVPLHGRASAARRRERRAAGRIAADGHGLIDYFAYELRGAAIRKLFGGGIRRLNDAENIGENDGLSQGRHGAFEPLLRAARFLQGSRLFGYVYADHAHSRGPSRRIAHQAAMELVGAERAGAVEDGAGHDGWIFARLHERQERGRTAILFIDGHQVPSAFANRALPARDDAGQEWRGWRG